MIPKDPEHWIAGGGEWLPRTLTLEFVSDPANHHRLFDYICSIWIESGKPRLRDILSELPRGLRVVYNVNIIESEVENGGFGQFFYNSSGELAQETRADLLLIGAHRHAAALDEAMELYEPFGRAKDCTERWFGATPDETEIDRVTNKYYDASSSESIGELLSRYILENPKQVMHSVPPPRARS